MYCRLEFGLGSWSDVVNCRLHYTFQAFLRTHGVCPAFELESVEYMYVCARCMVPLCVASNVDGRRHPSCVALDFLHTHIKLTSQLTQFLVHSI